MKEVWWDGFRVWEVKPWDGGFWFRGLGLLWARVMCWKRERDDEVKRERGASEMADGMGMEDAGSVERIRGSGNGEGRSRGFLWVWGSGTPKK